MLYEAGRNDSIPYYHNPLFISIAGLQLMTQTRREESAIWICRSWTDEDNGKLRILVSHRTNLNKRHLGWNFAMEQQD